jgi:nucleoside-diphosphate-sugar epimerase
MDVVFHLASKVGGIGYYLSKPSDVLMQAVLMDAFMLEAALARRVGRYLYASSAHIYPIELQQDVKAVYIKENQDVPAHPELSYGWGKLIGEKQIEYAVAQGLPIRAAILRLIGAYGPNQDLDLATGSCIPVFCRRAIEYPKGTGRETRSYCYIDDVLDAMLRSVEKLDDQAMVGPLNVGSEDLVSISDLARTIIKISGKRIPIAFDRSHKTVIWGQALDCSRATKELGGWRAKVSMRDGLGKVYDHIEGRLNPRRR